MAVELLQDDIYVRVAEDDRLHLRRMRTRDAGEPVLMVHGAMSNGRIFHSASGKGLAPFLARAGFDVFVLDLRGRGGSAPAIGPASRHGQTESICEDLPAAHARVRACCGDVPVHWVAHSWGGVLMHRCLLRHPRLLPQVRSCVYFACKRSIHARNLTRLIQIDLFWNRLARLIIRAAGYLPARALRLGIDNESEKSHRQCMHWARVAPWVDSDDGFDYAAAAREHALPPTLYLAAAHDPCLGHPEDVRRFRDESGRHRSRLHLLARETGYLHDYDHASVLTHPDAVTDHFPLVVQWLTGNYGVVAENY